jgi:hypothetical protein
MSTAVYPLGMKTMPASGYTHKSTYYNKEYKTWKGSGINQNPIAIAAGHIRPLTNKDPGNVFPTGFGLPRPIKHFRKGRMISSQPIEGVPNLIVNSPYNDVTLNINQNKLINYNINRFVKSSTPGPLGGSSSSSGLLNDTLGAPGSFNVKSNEVNILYDISMNDMNENCKTCQGIGLISSYQPNIPYITETPEKNTMNNVWCCNREEQAKKRVIYASTNLKKNYFTTSKEYLRNRCKTYDQKAFNFLSYRTNNSGPYDNNSPYYYSTDGNTGNAPGSPLTLSNTYLANCQLNTQLYQGTQIYYIDKMLSIMLNENILTQSQIDEFNESGINTIAGFYDWLKALPEPESEQSLIVFKTFINDPYNGMPASGPTNPAGCQLTVYKPNNYQYAKQGAVSSSTRLLKLNVNTISTNAASIQNYNNMGKGLITANQIYAGDNPNMKNLLKNKAPTCSGPLPLNFYNQFQNKKKCHYQKQLPEYQNPVSQPSPYRYFPGTVFRTNRYSQSPYTYNITTGSNAYH